MKTSLALRLVIIGGIAVILLVPIAMIESLVYERTQRRDAAVEEISSMWARPQLVSGPILVLPYRCAPTPATKDTPAVECWSRLIVQPRTLTIGGAIDPEIRGRSLFEAIVFQTGLRVTAVFAPSSVDAVPAVTELLWDRASVHVGIADPRGIARPVDLISGDARSRFMPGVGQGLGIVTGMSAPVGTGRPSSTGEYAISFDVALNGTREIAFSMGGDDVTVNLKSSWPHPSFTGAALPTTRTTDGSGFTATWRTGVFWKAAAVPSNQATGAGQSGPPQFGVALINPVDIYQQADRAVKYAVLFIGATFVIAFLWEITRGIAIHPVQYLFVGFAICVFYLLLLSISEHAHFDAAYAVASGATVLLLSWYWRWAAGGRSQGGLMGAILLALYSLLYLLLRLEDYALLAGSVALFAGLAITMFITRRVDWYQFGIKRGTRE